MYTYAGKIEMEKWNENKNKREDTETTTGRAARESIYTGLCESNISRRVKRKTEAQKWS